MPHIISINQERFVQFADREGIATTDSSGNASVFHGSREPAPNAAHDAAASAESGHYADTEVTAQPGGRGLRSLFPPPL
jgi:hypothetical protein